MGNTKQKSGFTAELAAALAAVLIPVGVAKACGFALFDYRTDVAIPAAVSAELHERGCATQYGAGERWTRHRHIYECVSATRNVPANALSYPVAQ
jgi:hypothetical protein